ncbi:hypothetical protein DFQ15_11221 [Xylophilus ampelinus]|uniref:Hydroxypyruvate isomerase n=1 Tax=Xylophilus ampelinus TaxID=54067 RepID=A0A318SKL0_9BURK|nr:hypothetical protein DFQ15_11221 [Xylophilus ampelinus]
MTCGKSGCLCTIHPRAETPPMPRFAANLSFLYQELDFLDRFAAAARDGFGAVEYLAPYPFPVAEIAARLRDHGLHQVTCPPGCAPGCLPGSS